MAFLTPTLLAVAGCDRSPTDHDQGPVSLFLYVDGEPGPFATYGSGAWEGAFPQMVVGESVEILGVFMDEDGQIPLGDEYTIGAVVDGPAGVATVTSHGDHLDVDAVGAGTTALKFELRHGGHADLETTALPVTVILP